MKKIAIFLFALTMLAFCGQASKATASTYYGYDTFGGTWSDANKTWSGDVNLCWAAAASNILSWANWDAGQTSSSNIFTVFRDHWTDLGSLPQFGWDWWMNGTLPPNWSGWSQVDVPGAGNYYAGSLFSNYYHYDYADSTAMTSINNFLHSGYGVTLAIRGPMDHAITAWGYTFDVNNPNYYTGIYVTDSDDHVNALSYYDLKYSGSQWYLQNYYGYNSAYIGEVYALDRNPVPIPPSVLLLAPGLIGIFCVRRFGRA